MGRRIGRAKACAAYRRIVTAARFLAAIISNLARASRTLVLRALFGASKSCALVNLFMDLPPMAGEQPADNDQILSLITLSNGVPAGTPLRRSPGSSFVL